METRKAEQQQPVTRPDQVVVSLTERRLADLPEAAAQLPPDLRPPPSVARYDSLLTGTSPS